MKNRSGQGAIICKPQGANRHRPACLRVCGILLGAAVAVFAAPYSQAVSQSQMQTIVSEIDGGHFKQADARIATGLADQAISQQERTALEFQRERMRRIRLDFSLSEADVLERLRKQIPDLNAEEFARWDEGKLIERLDIDGEKRYFNRSVSNLFLLSPEADARRSPPVKPRPDGPFKDVHPHHIEALQQAHASGSTSVAPRRIQVTKSLTVNADAVPAGETVRAWIPFPRHIKGQQEDIALIASVPSGAQVAPEDTLQRTAYLEKPAQAGKPTEFSVTYEITIFARHFDIDADKVVPAVISDELKPFIEARPPHIVFTDDIRKFSAQAIGAETNPYRIVQKLYAAVDKIPWGGAREYSTLTNISDYAMHAGHADCGQQTLLLMTLLRYNGIPARWQSGWVYSDDGVGHDNMHDWGQVYLAPYGWVPMDVSTGQLTSSDPDLHWFYLGGLDAYRITYNDDFSRELVPAKQHFRSETVDSQRGEVEWRGGNLYFDQWDYNFKSKMLPLKSSGR